MKLTFVFGLLLFTGCATATFSPYIGQQQNWPTAQGTFARHVRGIDIFEGLPARPYEVVGRLSIVGEPRSLDSQLAWKVKACGGDAAIIGSAQTFTAGSVNTGGASSTYVYGSAAYGQFHGNAVTTTAPSYSVPLYQTAVEATVVRYLPISGPPSKRPELQTSDLKP